MQNSLIDVLTRPLSIVNQPCFLFKTYGMDATNLRESMHAPPRAAQFQSVNC